MRTALVVLAGGSGSRVGAQLNKVYLPLAGRPVLSWSFTWARQVPQIRRFVLVVRPQDVELARDALADLAAEVAVELVSGGSSRHESEQAALDLLAEAVDAGDLDVIAIHDGARPLAGPGLFRSVLETAARVGGAVPVLPAAGVVPVGPDGAPLPWPAGAGDGVRRLARVQTPQAFRAVPLLAAYRAAAAVGHQGSDTAVSVQAFSATTVRAVPGGSHNLKVTYPHDVALAQRLLAAHDYRMP